jgi:endonuclease G
MNRRFPWPLVFFIAALVIASIARWSADRERAANDNVPANPIPDTGSQPQPEERDTWTTKPGAAPSDSIHLTMGNPSGATPDVANRDNFLMTKPYFALSYNNAKGTPNWVSWCLRESDLGNAPRSQFYPDPELPRSFKHVTPRDYSGSGFDRGHMCPHSDRSSNAEMANATFVMTNIIPQSPVCNQDAWADLEDYCRELVARKHRTLYLVSGPQGVGGEGTKGPADTIGEGKVTVPNKCWKIALVLEDGSGGETDIARVGPETRLIAVLMPNDQTVGHGWARYRTSAHEIERLTGYRFFDRVPLGIIEPLKKQVDHEHVPPPRPRKRGD